jgi:biotin operon repressor
MESMSLFRASDPVTSIDAAAAIAPHLSRLEDIVYQAVSRSLSGMTTKEIAAKTHLDRVTVSPRIKPLCDKGKLFDSTRRRGRSIVWITDLHRIPGRPHESS